MTCLTGFIGLRFDTSFEYVYRVCVSLGCLAPMLVISTFAHATRSNPQQAHKYRMLHGIGR